MACFIVPLHIWLAVIVRIEPTICWADTDSADLKQWKNSEYFLLLCKCGAELM